MLAVLQNPKADRQAKKEIESEIRRMAQIVDDHNAKNSQARELLTTIAENGFMNDENDAEAELAEIVWQCREFLTPNHENQ